jgi:hypothetical protein
MKPETAAFLKKFTMFFVLMGTFLALIIVSMTAISKSLTEAGARQQDAVIVNKVAANDERIPLEERIAEAQRSYEKLRTNEAKAQVGKNLAVLYEQLGKGYMQRPGGMESAESAFVNAKKLDPGNPAFAADLGDLYAKKASMTRDASTLAQIWMESGANWKEAAQNTKDDKTSGDYRSAAATAYYYAASSFATVGDRGSARQMLYEARALTAQGSQLANRIDSDIAMLNNQ